jgi:hypothetical protein
VAPTAGAFVYWANHNTYSIGRAGLDGSAADPKFAGLGESIPCGVAVDGRYVYDTASGFPGGIGRTPIGGGQSEQLIAGTTEPCGIAVYGHYLYWANGANYGSIGRANLAGPLGVQENFVPSEAASGRQDLNEPCGLAVGPTGIYWTDRGSGAIGHANLDGSGESTLLAGANASCGLALAGSVMYWPVNSSYAAGSGAIARALTSGVGLDPTFITGLNGPCGVAVFSHYLYISDSPTVDRTDLTSADPTAATVQITQDNEFGCGVAVDGLYTGTIRVLSARSQRGGAITLTVSVSNPGSIAVHQTPSSRLLRSLRARTARAGHVVLTLRPTSNARLLLRTHRTLTARVQLVFTPAGGAPSTVNRAVVLRRR